jgi:hypothetical protein
MIFSAVVEVDWEKISQYPLLNFKEILTKVLVMGLVVCQEDFLMIFIILIMYRQEVYLQGNLKIVIIIIASVEADLVCHQLAGNDYF